MKKILPLIILCLLFFVGSSYAQIGYDGKTVTPRVPGGDIMHYPAPGFAISTGYAWTTSIPKGTMTDTKYCTYTTANGISCTSEGGGGSMTWPGAAGIPVYSGSSSWSTSIAHPGVANRILSTDSASTYSWSSSHSHSDNLAQFYNESDSDRKIWLDASGLTADVTYKIKPSTGTATTLLLGSTLTDTKYCTYSTTTGLNCNSDGSGMSWPATAGIAVYSGSSSWGTSISHPGAANRVLYTDTVSTYSWASTHSHSNDGAHFYASSDDTKKILMDPSANTTGITQTIASTAKAASTYSLPPATAKAGDSLLSTTTISFAGNGDTALYTVPTGLRCVLTKAIIVANGDAGATTTVSIGANGSTTDFVPANTLSNLDAANDAVILMPIPNTTPLKSKSYAAGTSIVATVGSYSGTTGNTIYLFGFLY